MTNQDILEDFEVLYPEMKVKNAKPLDVSTLKRRQGITIELKNGDILLYFPKEE